MKPFLSLFVSKNPVIYNVISQENVFLFAIYFHLNMKLSPDKFFCFVTLKNYFSRAITPEKFAFSFLAIEGESMQ